MNQQNIRNFVIVAHIDHGKSTLADRLLELTETVPKDKMREQYLDQNPIERERGITIKLAPVRMNYTLDATTYTLNLIDTPGHVDFSYEVSRSLAAVEGAILLVDAIKGIQAQTISNVEKALEQNLTIIPVVNKIDLPNAAIEQTKESIVDTFGFKKEEILFISARTGENVEGLLEIIIKRVPAPKGDENGPLKALIFDSQYDQFKGVLAYVRVFDGEITKEDTIAFLGSGSQTNILEVGIFQPQLKPVNSLSRGKIGYIATGLKDVAKVRVGDTITKKDNPTKVAIPGYKEVKSMVFAAFFPVDNKDYLLLRDSLLKLKLNDASLSFESEYSDALGSGFRVGFLGLLHMEVVQDRLEREYNLTLIASLPTVKYRVQTTRGEEIYVERPAKLPSPSLIKTVEEPFITSEIIVPKEFLGGIVKLVAQKRGKITNMDYRKNQVVITAVLPLSEVITDFYSKLKNVSSGFASFDYEFLGYRPADVAKLDILVAYHAVDALSQIVIKENAATIGRKLVEKLKEAIPRQQFEVSIQAAIGGKIIARADVAAFRKDVTAKLYGGDRTRKDKLLESQKKGKKRMKMVGRIQIPQEAFLSVLKI